MARPFEVAREENTDIISAQVPTKEATITDVIEEGNAAEEVKNEECQVDTQIEALEEAAEEAENLLDIEETNTDKIESDENGTTEVTEDDVVVSEENLKYSMIKLGYDDLLQDRMSFATEARSSSMSARDKLQLSNEGVGDIIARTISMIKSLIKRIIISCKKLFAKILFKFGNYVKKIERLIKRLEDIKGTDIKKLDDDTLKEFAKKRLQYSPYEAREYEASNKFDKYSPSKISIQQMESFEKLSEEFIKSLIAETKAEVKAANKKGWFKSISDKIKSIFKSSVDGVELTKYVNPGSIPTDYSKANLLGVIGNTVYYIPDKIESRVIKTFKPQWKTDNTTAEACVLLLKARGSVTEEIGKLKKLLPEVKNAKTVFKCFDDNQAKYLKFLENLEKDIKTKDSSSKRALKVGLDILRVGAAEINLFSTRKFINDIKVAVKISNLYVSLVEIAEQAK